MAFNDLPSTTQITIYAVSFGIYGPAWLYDLFIMGSFPQTKNWISQKLPGERQNDGWVLVCLVPVSFIATMLRPAFLSVAGVLILGFRILRVSLREVVEFMRNEGKTWCCPPAWRANIAREEEQPEHNLNLGDVPGTLPGGRRGGGGGGGGRGGGGGHGRAAGRSSRQPASRVPGTELPI